MEKPILHAKLFRKSYLALVGAFILLLLAMAPVYAAPSLSPGSTASYDLTGKIQAGQNCTAAPANFTLQACYGITPPSPLPLPPPPPTVTVWIEDNSICQTNEPSCQFTPAVSNVPQGSTITWKNNGTLVHTVSSNAAGSTFNSGSIAPKGNFSYIFKFGGTYHYYDPSYTWMKGTINIPIIFRTPEPPSSTQIIFILPRPMQVDLSGTVNWNVEGLSTSQANLNVSHQINLSVSPFPGLSFTPLTESGSFEQSINLSTRVESPSTATSIVRSVSTSLFSALAGTTLATGVTGPVFQNMLSVHSNGPVYTMWWVNGPLSLGSPVQILQGWSSVTGSESLNLGTNIGTRSAWIVTSQLAQAINLSIPNPSNPLSSTTSSAAVSLKLLWSYDKSADLLLRNDNAASLTMQSVTPTFIGTATGPVAVTVTRDMALTIDVALLLSSTNLSLPKSTSHTSTLMDLLSAMPWMPLGLAGLAAGVAVAAAVWFTRKAKRATLPGPTPTTTPAPSPATPS